MKPWILALALTATAAHAQGCPPTDDPAAKLRSVGLVMPTWDDAQDAETLDRLYRPRRSLIDDDVAGLPVIQSQTAR